MKKRNEGSPYYPMFLNVRGKKCLVVGGGEVALRKVQSLLEHGANVEVVSPTLCPELSQMAGEGTIQALQRGYRAEDLEHALLAIAATDDAKTNESVAAEARQRGALVNVVDDPQHSDFIVPSYFSRGDVIVAVSTSGTSPALARKIRTRLEKDFGTEYAQLALLAKEVRSEMRRQGVSINSDAWQEVLDLDPLVELLKYGKRREAREIMVERLKGLGEKNL